MTQTTAMAAQASFIQRWAVPLAIALLTLLLALGGDSLRQLLRFERNGLVGGEWWRLLSAHFVHLGWSHLLYNLAGLTLIWALVGRTFSLWQGAALILLASLGISLGLWWLFPSLEWYVGFSGVLHSLLFAGAVTLALRGEREGLVLAVLVMAKIGWELWQGPMPGSREAAGGEVVVEAHALGVAMGLSYLIVLLGWRTLRGRVASPGEGR